MYAFAVSYETISSLPLDCRVPQHPLVEFSVTLREDKPAQLKLTAAVAAATREGAVLTAERLLDTVIGAMRAVGVCRFLESRNPHAKRPMMNLLSVAPRRPEDDFPAPMASIYADRLASLYFEVPADLNDLERRVLSDGDQPRALGRHLRTVVKTLAGVSERAQEVRNACGVAINAEHCLDFGVLVSVAFSCLEGLLLNPKDKSDVTARLSEAIAHSLGETVEEKNELRARVKKLYDVRSKFVHTGMVAETASSRRSALELMYRVLRRQMELLPELDT